jgi:hypothetical protein
MMYLPSLGYGTLREDNRLYYNRFSAIWADTYHDRSKVSAFDEADMKLLVQGRDTKAARHPRLNSNSDEPQQSIGIFARIQSVDSPSH